MAIAKLTLGTLYCHKTTEQGHDEIFAVVATHHSNGTDHTMLCPTGDGDADEGRAWDFNDSGDNQDRHLHYTLWSGALNNGEHVDIRVVFMESDGTDYGAAASEAGVLLSLTGDPFAVAAGMVLKYFGPVLPRNENDCLGGINVTIHNNGGRLEWSYGVSSNSPTRPTYRFGETNFFVHLRNVDGGDGSYDCYMSVALET